MTDSHSSRRKSKRLSLEEDCKPIPQKQSFAASMSALPTPRVAPCKCHVMNPSDWPNENGNICIALCMHICPYCGLDFRNSQDLNVHLSTTEYTDRGLKVIWTPREESELQRVIDLSRELSEDESEQHHTCGAIMQSLSQFSRNTNEILQGLTLCGLSEVSHATRELWKTSTITCPLVFGFQDCWPKNPPSTESVFLATAELIVASRLQKEKSKNELAKGSNTYSKIERICRAFGRATGDKEVDPWKALAQLHEPNRSNPISIIGYQLPEIIQDGAIKVPQELFPAKPINEGNLQLLMTPEFWTTSLLIDNFDSISTTLGPCEQVWLVFPPTRQNLLYIQRADEDSQGKLEQIGKYLEGGIIIRTNASEVLYLPAGSIHAILTRRGGFLVTNEFMTSRSAKVLSLLLQMAFNEFKYKSSNEEIFSHFLESIKAALENNEVELGLSAWVDALVPIREWANNPTNSSPMERETKPTWNDQVAEIFNAFFASSASKDVCCPCGEANEMFSFQDHFRQYHLLAEAPPGYMVRKNRSSAKARKSVMQKRKRVEFDIEHVTEDEV